MRKIWEHLLHFHQFQGPTFRKTTLPRVGNDPKLTGFFSFYLMDEVFEFLAYETNCYAERCKKAFLIMGIIKLPSLHDYWQQNRSFFAIPSFGKVISPDWYKQIHCYLHFCHEEESIPKDQPGHHPLYKIRGLLNLIIPKFQSLYVPNQNICIDESMIPFKGRISFHQCIPSKHTRFGIKVWILAQSKSGYMYGFSLYAGTNCWSSKRSV